jgi:predicted enzyme related to lactoylglutathione lyase
MARQTIRASATGPGTWPLGHRPSRRRRRRVRAYIYVADVADTLDAVTAHGGQVVEPPYPEGTLRVALIADPAGNVIGVWQQT